MPSLKTRLAILHYIGAALGAVLSAMFALLSATFACDAPSSDLSVCYAIGGVTLIVTLIFWSGLPILAAIKVSRAGAGGLMLSVIYSVLILFIFPIGTLLGGAQLYLAWRLNQAAPQQSAP